MGGLAASHRLKSLNVTRTKLLSVRKKARMAINVAEANLKDADKQLLAIDAEIETIDGDEEATPSEHALLRYIERYTDIDVEDIASKIMELPPEKKVRRGNTIVTILDEVTSQPPQTESQE